MIRDRIITLVKEHMALLNLLAQRGIGLIQKTEEASAESQSSQQAYEPYIHVHDVEKILWRWRTSQLQLLHLYFPLLDIASADIKLLPALCNAGVYVRQLEKQAARTLIQLMLVQDPNDIKSSMQAANVLVEQLESLVSKFQTLAYYIGHTTDKAFASPEKECDWACIIFGYYDLQIRIGLPLQ